MYAEMLAEGMVHGEKERGEYLGTLRAEADRLGHLLENVLAYARLEGSGPGGRLEVASLGQLVEKVEGRLRRRAKDGGMDLVAETSDEAFSASVRADPSAVEQVLFNLVDNACKYAGSAADRRIHLEADRSGDRAVLRVRDHGPGIRSGERTRLFRPFSKSAAAKAGSAPGVGLGLALSMRLARSMRGDLRLDRAVADGAAFALSLPLVRLPR
jgi:signal transduction histidine kinase